MKPPNYLVTALLSAVLMVGCNSRQQSQQMAQPLVSGQAPPAQQAAAQEAQPAPAAPAQYPPQYAQNEPAPPPQPPPAVEEPAPEPRYEREPGASPRYRRNAPLVRERAPSALSIPAGTPLDVRLEETIDTKRNRAGDPFEATLTRSVLVDEQTAIPSGTRFTGHLIESQPSGRLKGHAELSLSLDSFDLRGRRYEIRTTHIARASGGHKKRNWVLIGGGSGLGTALGAIAGGPAGALIGAGAGAGAGTAGAVFTGRKNVRLPVETPLAFTLRAPVVLAN